VRTVERREVLSQLDRSREYGEKSRLASARYVLGRRLRQFRFIDDIRQTLAVTAFDSLPTEEEQRTYRHENRAERSEHKRDVFAH